MTSLPETVFAKVLEEHREGQDFCDQHQVCSCGWDGGLVAPWRGHVARQLAACLVFVGVEHEKGGQLYRVGRCPDDSPVYAIRDKETPVNDEEIPSNLIVEALDPNCLMLLLEGKAEAVVDRLGDDGPPNHTGTVRLYRNNMGVPMVHVFDMDTASGSVKFALASVKRITVL